jgi:hypothetical protein
MAVFWNNQCAGTLGPAYALMQGATASWDSRDTQVGSGDLQEGGHACSIT